MIRKLASGGYRLYSRKKDARTGKRKNLGTFGSRAAAEKHERDVQYFKRHWAVTAVLALVIAGVFAAGSGASEWFLL